MKIWKMNLFISLQTGSYAHSVQGRRGTFAIVGILKKRNTRRVMSAMTDKQRRVAHMALHIFPGSERLRDWNDLGSGVPLVLRKDVGCPQCLDQGATGILTQNKPTLGAVGGAVKAPASPPEATYRELFD